MRLQDLVHPEAIIANLGSTNRSGVIRELVQKLADAGRLESSLVEGIVKSITTRERTRGSTGFGKGVAIPHAKVAEIDRVIAAVGRSEKGIDFAALDGEPVYGVFVILSPESDPEAHLKAMDLIFRNLQQEKFRKFLRQSETSEKIYDLLREADEQTLVA